MTRQSKMNDSVAGAINSLNYNAPVEQTYHSLHSILMQGVKDESLRASLIECIVTSGNKELIEELIQLEGC